MDNKFDERLTRWTEISVSQLSTANNILITISSGLLAFIFKRKLIHDIVINTDFKLNHVQLFYVCSLLFLLISIGFGLAVLFTRLYDFRITRHILHIKKKISIKHNGAEIKVKSDATDINFCHRLKTLIAILFVKIPFISAGQIETSKPENLGFDNDFKKLLNYSKILGTSTWRWTKLQAGSFMLSVFTYILHLIF
jgi:hypothetical protein